MIKHLKDHRGVPLLFGIITKSEPIRLVTKFHRNKNKGLTLHKAIKKEKLEKPTWLEILKKIIEALNHIHSCGIPHNDVKSNNVVMEQRGEEWNPVIIDFGQARFPSDPKPAMSMSTHQQEKYWEQYPHIASEIVNGSGRQSAQIWHIFFRENSFGSIGFAPNSDSKIVEGGQNCSAKSQQNAPP